MLNTPEDDAVLYVLGLLEPVEVVRFEHQVCLSRRLKRLVDELATAAASFIMIEALELGRKPSPHVREQLMRQIRLAQQQQLPVTATAALSEAHFSLPNCRDCVIISDRDGLIRWANPAFTSMCGYSLEELQGRSAGAILRGRESARDAQTALSRAVHHREPVLQQIVNYRKDGTPYRVEIDLRPVSTGFIAMERQLFTAA